eukprot:NODE_420_length_7765_cov_0.831855.p4 type:complete len:293 gc:universal NODE_420_length_7765_cov_0.831855:2038-1160(-)
MRAQIMKHWKRFNFSTFHEFHPIRLEWRRSGVAFIYALAAFTIGAAMLFVSENNYVPQDALFDRFLNNIPNYKYLAYVANALTMTELWLSIIFMITIPAPWNLIVIRRALIVLGTLFFTRGIFIVMTTVPSPLGMDCKPDIIKDEYAIIRLLQLMSGTHSNCTDNIFSGHTSTVLTACIQIHFYCKFLTVRILSWLLSICAITFVLISRLHYTVDVLCALVIGLLMHYMFVIAVDSDSKYYIVKFVKYLDGVDIRNKFRRNLRASSGDDIRLESLSNEDTTQKNVTISELSD